jgi:hypothetical protein
MKLDRKLRFYSITNEIKWAILWFNIARVAYGSGDVACGSRARARGDAAYRKARRLLETTDNTDDEQLRSIKADLETLGMAVGSLREPSRNLKRLFSI